jgi:hypothetical protein
MPLSLAPLSLYAITWIQVSMSFSTNEHLYQLYTSVRRVCQVYYTNSAFRAFQTSPTLHVEERFMRQI